MPIILRNAAEVDAFEKKVQEKITCVIDTMQTHSRSARAILWDLKFGQTAIHPVSGEPTNFVEFLNQSFTCLATIAAVRKLMELHAERTWHCCLCEESGVDIADETGTILAEAFAATHPRSNKKLAEDRTKLRGKAAEHKYVFFSCPTHPPGPRPQMGMYGVQVWSLGATVE